MNVLSLDFLCIFLICNGHATKPETFQLPIFFPRNRPQWKDSYLCTSVSLKNLTDSASSSLYIEAFTPVAEMFTVHHMLLYGCLAPGTDNVRIWNCGEMYSDEERRNSLPVAGICSQGLLTILYAWARNARRLELPKNVAFRVGGSTEILSLVLQIHSGDHHNFQQTSQASTMKGLTDAGIVLQVSHKPADYLAGVYLLGTTGTIPPHSTVHLDAACMLNENKEIYPFAYRTHSHSLGKVISGYRVRSKDSRLNEPFEWTLIGKKDPQLPQMFYSVENPGIVVRRGDILAARCTMESNRTKTTHIGMGSSDEMCNFYIMYYVKEGNLLENNACFNFGPHYDWKMSSLHLDNFPVDASTL